MGMVHLLHCGSKAIESGERTTWLQSKDIATNEQYLHGSRGAHGNFILVFSIYLCVIFVLYCWRGAILCAFGYSCIVGILMVVSCKFLRAVYPKIIINIESTFYFK